MNQTTLVQRLSDAIGSDYVYADRANLTSYEYDAGFERRMPDVVVLPQSTVELQAVVRIANDAGVPIVARGAGTGLCNGAIPLRGGIVVSLTRMNRILEVDYRNRWAIVEPGVINLELSEHTLPHGWYYAPDPSSQRYRRLAATSGQTPADRTAWHMG